MIVKLTSLLYDRLSIITINSALPLTLIVQASIYVFFFVVDNILQTVDIVIGLFLITI